MHLHPLSWILFGALWCILSLLLWPVFRFSFVITLHTFLSLVHVWPKAGIMPFALVYVRSSHRGGPPPRFHHGALGRRVAGRYAAWCRESVWLCFSNWREACRMARGESTRLHYVVLAAYRYVLRAKFHRLLQEIFFWWRFAAPHRQHILAAVPAAVPPRLPG